MSAFIFGNIVDAINKYRFHIVLRSSYVPELPLAVRSGEVNPIHDDIHSVTETKLSLKYVIDMIFQEVSFDIIEPEVNIPLMVDLLGQYLAFMAGFQNIDEESKEFIARASAARAKLLPLKEVFSHRAKTFDPQYKKSILDLIGELNP